LKTHIVKIVWGIMLACFEKTQPLPKHARQSQEPEESKKQVQFRQIGTNKPETQWFCVHNDDLILKNIEHKPRRAQSAQRKHKQELIKRSATVFLMRMGLCKRLIAGLTKRFGYFGAPKCAAFLSTNKNNMLCEKLPCPRGIERKKNPPCTALINSNLNPSTYPALS
jgi:hypothetical protein